MIKQQKMIEQGFPGGTSDKKYSPANSRVTRDADWIPQLGRSPGGGHDSLHQYSCLVNPMDRGAWLAPIHRITKSQTKLKQLSTQYTHVTKVKVKVAYSCPTLCDPMDHIVHGILQTRILEWVAFPFPRGSSHTSLKLSHNRKTYNHFSKIHMHIRITLHFFKKYKCPGFFFFFPLQRSRCDSEQVVMLKEKDGLYDDLLF